MFSVEWWQWTWHPYLQVPSLFYTFNRWSHINNSFPFFAIQHLYQPKFLDFWVLILVYFLINWTMQLKSFKGTFKQGHPQYARLRMCFCFLHLWGDCVPSRITNCMMLHSSQNPVGDGALSSGGQCLGEIWASLVREPLEVICFLPGYR